MLAAALAGALVRLLLLGEKSLWYDEALSLAVSGQPDLAAVLGREASISYGSPLFFAAQHAWLAFGRGEFAVRLLPWAGSVVALLLSLALCVSLVPRRSLAAAAWLVALLPFLVEYGQEARMYSWLLAGQLAASLFLLQGLSRPLSRWWIYYGATLAAGALVHQGIWIWWLAHIPLAFLLARAARLRFLFASLPGIGVTALLIQARAHPWAERLAAPNRLPEALEYLRQTFLLMASGHHVGTLAEAVLPWLVALSLIAGLGILFLRRERPETALFIGCQALLPVALVYAGIWAGLSTQLRYAIGAPVFLALLLVFVFDRFPPLLRQALVALLLAQQAHTFYRYHERAPTLEPTFCLLTKKPLRPVAEMLRAGMAPGDRILHVFSYSFFPMRWMLPGAEQLHVLGVPEIREIQDLYGGARPLTEAVRGARRIWLVVCPIRYRDPLGILPVHRAVLERMCEEPVWADFPGGQVYLAKVRPEFR